MRAVRHSRLPLVPALATLAFIALATYLAWPLLPSLADPIRTRTLVAEAGAWAPLAFIGLQVLQVVVAPIPGQPAVIAAGYLFGPWLGLFYSLVGGTIGTAIVFSLSRGLGRPFVTRFVSEARIERFDRITDRRGPLIFFLIFLLPALPDDVIAFAAGLSSIGLGMLVLVSAVGRLPGYLVLSMTGHGLTTDDLTPVTVLAVALAVVFAIGLWQHKRITRLLERLGGRN